MTESAIIERLDSLTAAVNTDTATQARSAESQPSLLDPLGPSGGAVEGTSMAGKSGPLLGGT